MNNLVPNYTGAVHFSSTDSQALLPADYTFTPADHGSHAFVVSLRSPGGRTMRVSDTVVGQADAVTARDAYGNLATAYAGTIRFSTVGPIGMVPAAYTFQAGDHGVHTFSATLETAGTLSLRATDTAGNFFGEQTGITVVPGPVNYFVVGGPA